MTTMDFLGALLSLILINLVLSGDNAIVIALATRSLGEREKRLGIIWGTVGAVVLKILFTAIAALILKVPFIRAVGGLLLVDIAIKLIKGDDSDENVEAASSLAGAIKTIIFADLIMSLDNILAIAGVAGDNLFLLILGLAISIPIVVFGSSLLSNLMNRFPILVYIGAGLIAWTAGDMILSDSFFEFLNEIHILHYLIPTIFVVFVIFVGKLLKDRRKNRQQSAQART